MKLSATLANGAWLAFSLASWERFRRALVAPEYTQLRQLRGLLTRDANCAYGRRHGFRDLRTYAEFARRVPIVTCDDLLPWIERIKRGEQNVLCSDRVTHLVPTGGSTGGRKLIPFTRGLQAQFDAAVAPWMVDLCRTHPSISLGPAYWSVSPATRVPQTEASALPIGFEDDTAYLGGAKRILVTAAMAAPSSLREVGNLDHFRRLALLHLLRCEDLRLISVWHPSFLGLLLTTLTTHWDSLVATLKSGGCGDIPGLSPQTAARIAIRPHPRRAVHLASVGPSHLQTIWPKLRVVSCWGDAHAGLALGQLARRLPHVAIQPKGLLATEGVITIPFREMHPAALTSHFFEFVDEDGRVCLLHELETSRVYEVLLTTAGGLWRYRIGDRVKVDGFVGATPSLRFVGRTEGGSDRFGEKLTEAFVADVFRQLWSGQTKTPRFAMLAPEEHQEDRWRYTLYVEGPVSRDLAERLDKQLCANPQYAYCRALGQLDPAALFTVDEGADAVFLHAEVERGRCLGEIKPTALSTASNWSERFSNHASTNP